MALLALPATLLPAQAGDPSPATDLTIEWVGSIGGSVRAVAVEGDYAYLGEGAALTVLDVSDPAQPVRVSRLALPGIVQGIHIVGDYAYVADMGTMVACRW